MKPNSYDFIAPAYDFLAKLVFGKKLLEAQLHFLSEVTEGAEVLVIGGGTGEFLPELWKRTGAVDYIEASAKMLERAMLRKVSGDFVANLQSVRFILGDEHSIPDKKYDVVITCFFLDLFEEKHLEAVIGKLAAHLKPGGKWLVADFVENETTALKRRLLLRLMYLFFSIFTNIEAKRLHAPDEILKKNGLILAEEFWVEREFLRGEVWMFDVLNTNILPKKI